MLSRDHDNKDMRNSKAVAVILSIGLIIVSPIGLRDLGPVV